MVKLTLWLGFFLRLFNAFVNGLYGSTYGSSDDALGFHLTAVEHSQNLVFDVFVIGHIYSYILGIFYFITTDSLFLGSALSALGWLASAFILLRVMRILSFDRSNQWRVMLIYALIPSSLAYTSVTLREPFQLLFVNLALYAVLKIYFHKSIAHWLVLFLAAVGMGALHGALLASSIFMIVGTLFLLTSRNRKGVSFIKVVLVTPIVILCLFYGFLLFTSISYGDRMEDGLSLAVQTYQEGAIGYEGRAIYRTDVEINGLGGLILSIPSFLFQYLFEPMPWKMSSMVDVVALLENMLRFWLIWNALKYLVGTYLNKPMFVAHNAFGNRKFYLFIFLSYLIMETIWSLGTTNWGTSMRHHLPSLGLLLVASFAYRNVTSSKYNRSHKS
ncbi:MAG TPA: hypothetical protein DCS80_05025 [Betaproteobacteria bacterium]|nr:hypothetical protein [Betaproteobacteria bacterium]